MAHHVNFEGILQQQFDFLAVKNNKLLIQHKNHIVEAEITDSQVLVAEVLVDYADTLLDENGVGSVRELMKFPVVNFWLQKARKRYVDDLVYALYFNVKISEIGFQNRESVHKACKKHKYYAIINGETND